MYLVHSVNLALMARAHVPLDIVLKHRPPEAYQKTNVNGVYTLMSELIVCCSDQGKLSVHRYNFLVSTAALSVP